MSEPSSDNLTLGTLSIVIPAYNEAGRIGIALRQIADFSAKTSRKIDLLIVNDGSSDTTTAVVESFQNDGFDLNMIQHETNRGKGAAVRTGMTAATGDAVLMCDADMSTPIEDVDRLLAKLDEGFDVVIGSRVLPDSIVDPPQKPLRRIMGWTFRRLRRMLMLSDIADTQCGFKLFTRDVAHKVFTVTESDGFAFDCEVLELARRYGCRIAEVGVHWANCGDSTVTLLDAPRTLLDLMRIRKRLKSIELPPAE